MIEAQNEMRRRGRARADAGGCRANGAGGRGDSGAPAGSTARRAGWPSSRTSSASSEPGPGAGPPTVLARALIVGCGCRARELGQRLVDAGWQVRGNHSRPGQRRGHPGRRAGGGGRRPGSVGSILDHVGDVTLVFWLLGSAEGEPRRLAAIHGPRLERLMEELVDTPVRRLRLRGGGQVERAPPRAWRRDRPRGGGALADPGRGGGIEDPATGRPGPRRCSSPAAADWRPKRLRVSRAQPPQKLAHDPARGAPDQVLADGVGGGAEGDAAAHQAAHREAGAQLVKPEEEDRGDLAGLGLKESPSGIRPTNGWTL